MSRAGDGRSTWACRAVVGSRSARARRAGRERPRGAKMDDGEERIMEPGDLFYVPPGHDSWVVGNEPYISIHVMGSENYPA